MAGFSRLLYRAAPCLLLGCAQSLKRHLLLMQGIQLCQLPAKRMGIAGNSSVLFMALSAVHIHGIAEFSGC